MKRSKVDTEGLRIDSHKLMYHVERVNDWRKGKDIFPIFLDVSPTSACNHNCFFCGLDFAHKNKTTLKTKVLKDMIKDAARCGVKSIMFAGEGEPLLHKDIAEIIKFTKDRGIDAAMTTNAVYMDRKFMEGALEYLTWIRISIDAGTPKTYAKIHGTKKEDFEKVISNIHAASLVKKKKKSAVTIGTQFLLLDENKKELEQCARRVKKAGADYIIVKPYSKHPRSINDAGTELDYSKLVYLEKKLGKYSDNRFKVIFRKETMRKRFKDKIYTRCLGAPFWAYISATGDIYPCHTFLGLDKYSFGNINKKTFCGIWKGKKRKDIMRYFNNTMDARHCREICRLDNINTYLWQLRYPHPHVNFI